MSTDTKKRLCTEHHFLTAVLQSLLFNFRGFLNLFESENRDKSA